MSHEFALEWMNDYTTFQDALDSDDNQSYMSTLIRSMAMVLEEFYSNLRAVGVSSVTGEGMEQLFEALEQAKQQFNTEYRPEMEASIAKRREEMEEQQKEQLEKFRIDLDEARGGRPVSDTDTEEIREVLKNIQFRDE